MRKEDAFYLGYISKTYSFRGEVIAFFEGTEPQQYEKLESVFVDINNKLVPFFLEHIRFDRKGAFARIKFEGVDDEKAAQMLIKKEMYLPAADQPERESENSDPTILVGYTVQDSALSEIGTVVSFIDHQTNPLLDVSGERGNTFIPFHDAFIRDIDHEKGIIHVDIPEDLIGLND